MTREELINEAVRLVLEADAEINEEILRVDFENLTDAELEEFIRKGVAK